MIKNDGKSSDPEPGVTVKDMTIRMSHGDMPIHVFTPEGKADFPVMVYYQGRGFLIADTKAYESSPRIGNRVEAIMVAVDYRQAPENKFPAAADAAFSAWDWVVQDAQEMDGDPTRAATGRESASGNLATVASLMGTINTLPALHTSC